MPQGKSPFCTPGSLSLCQQNGLFLHRKDSHRPQPRQGFVPGFSITCAILLEEASATDKASTRVEFRVNAFRTSQRGGKRVFCRVNTFIKAGLKPKSPRGQCPAAWDRPDQAGASHPRQGEGEQLCREGPGASKNTSHITSPSNAMGSDFHEWMPVFSAGSIKIIALVCFGEMKLIYTKRTIN